MNDKSIRKLGETFYNKNFLMSNLSLRLSKPPQFRFFAKTYVDIQQSASIRLGDLKGRLVSEFNEEWSAENEE